MAKFNIFISYRRKGTADKAEHLLSLLEDAGYKHQVSFDRENLTGTFDLEILRRIDLCTDFILLVSEYTFQGIDAKEEDFYIHLAQCSVEEFDQIQIQRLKANRKIDFVRFEIARALSKKKNIIVVVPISTPNFNFDDVPLPNDIAEIKRLQAVFYNDSKHFLFRSIIPNIEARLLSHKRSHIRLVISLITIVLVFLSLFAWLYIRSYNHQLENCRTLNDYDELLSQKIPDFIQVKAVQMKEQMQKLSQTCVYVNNSKYGYDKYQQPCSDSLQVIFSSDLSLQQLTTVREMFDQMMLIPKGNFLMGRNHPVDIEGPQHLVELTEDFYLGQFELTRKQWFVLQYDSLVKESADHPITGVSWNEIQKFIQQLNTNFQVVGFKFSLPTEAQWEYAAKARQSYDFSGSQKLEEVANLNDNTVKQVGLYQCNAFNLYNMTGNVKEWCLDGGWHPYCAQKETDPVHDITLAKHIIRGGSYLTKKPQQLNVAFRDTYSGDAGSEDLGFRLALVVDEIFTPYY